MYVDAVTVAALADELGKRLAGGRVQSIVEIDALSLGFEVYAGRQRHYLLITARPEGARCQLVSDRLRRGTTHPSPLGLQLRKYVDGSRLNAITQPLWERILYFDFSGDHGEVRLIVEMMDRRSNIILTTGGDVMEAIKRIGPDRNRYRVTLPGKPYEPPPQQRKDFPEAVSPAMLVGYLRQAGDAPVWRALVDHIAGISPLFARQIVFEACGDTEAPSFDVSGELVYASFSRLIGDIHGKRWLPSVVPAPEGAGYVAFAAYKLSQFENWEPAESISGAMATYFGAPVGIEAYEPAKERVRGQLEAALDRTRRRLAALQRQIVDQEEIELLRKKGELLYAYGPTLEPGQLVLRAEYDLDGPPIEVEIDPALTPVENAQQYFARYEKAKRARADVPAMIERVRQELVYLEQIATDLDLAENWPEIDAVREALQAGGYWQGARIKGPAGGKPGLRRFTVEGYVIFVGRNAAQNHALVTEKAGRDDLWLHARGIPGSHVIIRSDGRPIPEHVIRYAAQLAAYYSAARGEASVEVDVTKRRHVRLVKGGKPGMVTYRGERTLAVRAEKP